jgi:flagellar motor switch protein FliN/FliY
LDSVIVNEALDRYIAGADERMRATLEQSLTSFLEREIKVASQGPQVFDFKELKAALPGEVVFVSLTATDGGPGKALFALSKENATVIADQLLMGDGKAAFSHEEHLEPIRDLFKEIMASFAAGLGKEIGRHLAFDEIKVALVDLAAADFVGTGWVMSRFEIGVEPGIIAFQMTSTDFFEACFPDAEVKAEAPETFSSDEQIDAAAKREMGMVLDIELPISIELGRTSMLIRDIVKLAPGSIVELDKLSGEPVDMFVNGRLFARGEVVVVDENFGVRITGLVTPNENNRARRN